MLLALPCGRDPLDVHAQTRALKTGFITYLQVKQAAGIINIVNSATKQVVFHVDCPFTSIGAQSSSQPFVSSAFAVISYAGQCHVQYPAKPFAISFKL